MELFFYLHLLEIEELMVLFARVKLAESFLKINFVVLLIFQRKIIIRSEINPKNNICSESTKTMMSWAYDRNN